MLSLPEAVPADAPVRRYIKWTPELDDRLRAAFADTKDNHELAERLGLPYNAVSHHCNELKLLRRPPGSYHSGRWEPADEDLLRLLWARGLHASQIATELGGRFSRSAVIGKAHRLKLSARAKNHRSPTKPTRFTAPRIKGPVRSAPFRHRPLLYLAVDNSADEDIPQDQRKSIMELNEHTCRWPVGDPQNVDFFYCGAESAGFTYCPKHTAKAHNTFKSVGEVASRVIEKLEAQMTHDNTHKA